MTTPLWSQTIGAKGNKVRLFERTPGGPIYRSIFLNGKEDKRSLGHTDRKKAVQTAYELLAGLQADEEAEATGSVTLGALVARYMASPSYLGLKPSGAGDVNTHLGHLKEFFGEGRDVATLTRDDFKAFIQARTRGTFAFTGAKALRVSLTSAKNELVSLRTACNWAYGTRDAHGRRLLADNPMHGYRMPNNPFVRRHVPTHDEFTALLAVAQTMNPRFALALVVAEGTGHRIAAILHLQWADLNLAGEAIRWRMEHDKKGNEDVTWMPPGVKAALLAWRDDPRRPVSPHVFPAVKDATRPQSYDGMMRWLRKAYKRAGFTWPENGGWHALRRKWATERKHAPLKDVMRGGGWRSPTALLASYQHADDESVRHVIANPKRYGQQTGSEPVPNAGVPVGE